MMEISRCSILIVLILSLIIGCKSRTDHNIDHKIEEVTFSENHVLDVRENQVLETQELQGKELYLKHCSQCHGSDGQGHPEPGHTFPPVPGPLVHLSESNSKDSVKRIIENGIQNTGMYPFKDLLTDEEISAIIDHLWRLEDLSNHNGLDSEDLHGG